MPEESSIKMSVENLSNTTERSLEPLLTMNGP